MAGINQQGRITDGRRTEWALDDEKRTVLVMMNGASTDCEAGAALGPYSSNLARTYI